MKKLNKILKETQETEKKLKSVNNGRFRISIYKSLNNMSAQIIDDNSKNLGFGLIY